MIKIKIISILASKDNAQKRSKPQYMTVTEKLAHIQKIAQMRDIIFTKRKYDEIVEAWNYNCAASCNKAISELSEFAKE